MRIENRGISPSSHTASSRGQGLTEYTIAVALLAIGVIAAVGLFGDELRTMFEVQGEAASFEMQTMSEGGTHDKLSKFSELQAP